MGWAAYRCRKLVHQAAVKHGPASVKVVQSFDEPAMHRNESASRINVCDYRANKSIVYIREISVEDWNNRAYVC